MAVSLEVNGLQHTVDVADATPLLFVLRNDLGLNGAKLGCGAEQCGSCTVLVDGEPTYSCTARAGDVVGKRLLTVEGLSDDGVSHPLQAAFLELNSGQCVYCLAGIIMAYHPETRTADLGGAMGTNEFAEAVSQAILAGV